MSIYEAIGMAWVVFTAAIATVEILYLAFVGLKEVTSNRAVKEDYRTEIDGILERSIRGKTTHI